MCTMLSEAFLRANKDTTKGVVIIELGVKNVKSEGSAKAIL
jgi:hypothetical protein